MASSGLKIAFGTGGFGAGRVFGSVEEVHEVFKVMQKHGCNILDTAALRQTCPRGPGAFWRGPKSSRVLATKVERLRVSSSAADCGDSLYEGSEQLLGEAGATSWNFVIDSKALGGWSAGSATRQNVLETARESCRRLGLKGGKGSNLDIFYMHAPDKDVPVSETCAGINDAYKEGLFQRFGLSNYSAQEVQAVYDACQKEGWVLPTAYQGNYSPVARKQEEILFPTLRKLGMAFYAYSPMAGGFLTKTKDEILAGKGRFDTSTPLGKMYSGLYARPAFLEALAKWEQLADAAGIGRAEMAYRWVVYNSPLNSEHGDACIVGASRVAQLEETFSFLEKGPLAETTCNGIDEIWESIKHEAGIDNFVL